MSVKRTHKGSPHMSIVPNTHVVPLKKQKCYMGRVEALSLVTVPYYINSMKNPRGKKTLWLYFDSGPRRGLGERRPCGYSLTRWRDIPLFSLKGTESMHTSNRWQKSDKNVLLDLDLWPLDLKTHVRYERGQKVVRHFYQLKKLKVCTQAKNDKSRTEMFYLTL